MNYKKGLVALAITGALATPFANAADIRAFGGQDVTNSTASVLNQTGPQAGVVGQMNFFMNGTGASGPVLADDLTIDQILAGTDVVVDLDADGTPATNGPFIGSMRTDVSVGYAADVTIPNEATYEIVINNYGQGNDFDEADFAANNPGGFADSLTGELVLVAQEAGTDNFRELGGAIDTKVVNGVIVRVLIQIDTNVDTLDGITWVDSATGLSQSAPQLRGEAIEAGTQIFLATRDNNNVYNPLQVELTAVAEQGDVVDVSIPTVTNTGGLELSQLAAGNTRLVTVGDGFQLQVVDQATSTIEVENDRTTFADCESSDETVTTTGPDAGDDYVCAASGDRLTSRAKLMFTSSSDVSLDINQTNTMSFDLSREDGESVSGVSTVAFGSVGTSKNSSDVYQGSGSLLNIGLFDASNVRQEANLDITASGTAPLFPNSESAEDWVLENVVISGGNLPANTKVNVPVVYGETNTVLSGNTYVRKDSNSVELDRVTHVWGIDGALFKTPYVYSIPGAAGWSSTIKVTNEFNTPAGIQADIIVAPAGLGVGGNAGNTFIGVKLPLEIPAMGQYTFSGTQLIEAINAQFGAGTLDESAAWHIEATFLVNAPQNYVHAAAQNSSPSGRADSPVLYKTNNSADGRQWQ